MTRLNVSGGLWDIGGGLLSSLSRNALGTLTLQLILGVMFLHHYLLEEGEAREEATW